MSSTMPPENTSAQNQKRYISLRYPEYGGKIYTIDRLSPDFDELSKGGVPLSEIEEQQIKAKKFARTGAGKLASAGIGIANAPTLGLAELLIGESGLADKETLKALREENPFITSGTEIAADIALALATGGASTAAKAGTKLGKDAAELGIEQAAKAGAKEAAQETTARAVAKRGLEALAAPVLKADEIGQKLGEKLAIVAKQRGIGTTGQKIAEAAGRGAAPAAIYGALSEVNESSLYDQQLTPEAIFQSMIGGALLGAIGGTGIEGISYGSKAIRDKVNKYGEKLYPYIIGEDTVENLAKSDTLLSPAEIDFANAYGIKIPQVNKMSSSGRTEDKVEAIRNAANFIMNKVSPIDGQPIFVPGFTRRQNVERLADFKQRVGDDLENIYALAKNQNILLQDSLDDIINGSKNLLTEEGLPYSKKWTKFSTNLIKEVLEPYRNKSIGPSDFERVQKSMQDFIGGYKSIPNLQDMGEDTLSGIVKSINEASEIIKSSKDTNKTYMDLYRLSVDKFKSNTGNLNLGESIAYKKQLEEAKIAMNKIIGSSRRLNASDVSVIKRSLIKEKNQFKAHKREKETEIADKLHKYINDKLGDAIVEAIPDKALADSFSKEFKSLKKDFATVSDFVDVTSDRANIVSMHDKKGLLSTIREAQIPQSMGTAGTIAGAMFGGPVGGAIGYGVGLGANYVGSKIKSKAIEAEKEILPGIRARRAYAKAGTIVADSETRGFFGKIERLITHMNDNLGKKPEKLPKGESSKHQRFGKALEILNARAGSRKESEEEKVAQFSDGFKVAAAGNNLATSMDKYFDGTFGSANELYQTKQGVVSRAEQVQNKLSRLLPTGPNLSGRNPYTPLAKTNWKASTIDTQRAIRAIEAIQNPISELQAAASGDINIQALDLVKTAYPYLYETSISGLLQKISERRNPLTLEEKSILHLLTKGTKFESYSIPESANLIQTTLGTEEAAQNASAQIQKQSSQKLTQNSINKIGNIKESMGTFSDNLGTEN